MTTTKLSRLKKWSINGALIGLGMALLDITGWRGQTYAPWTESNAISMNLSYILGSVIGGAFLFLVSAAVVNLFLRE